MKQLFTFAFIFFVTIVSAQNPDRKYIAHNLQNDILEIKTSDGDYRIKFYTPDIVETTFVPEGEHFKAESHAVVLQPQNISAQLQESSIALNFISSGLEVRFQKSPLKLTYIYKNKVLLSEKNGYTKRDSTETIDFNLTDSEVLYGGGARVLGMNRRGNRLQLYNRAHYGYETRSELMNFTMPIVMSSNLYAVHFDNAPIGYLDLDSQQNNTLTYETISGRKTYQVVAGETWKDIVSNYTLLTGRQPMPPRWAFGNFASRFGYHSQTETEMTIKKFRDEKIPVDAVILDLYWFGKEVQGTMGNLEVFRDSFPEFEKMIANFKADGIKTIPVTEPFILTTSNRWNEAVEKKILATDSVGNPFTYDFYFGNTGLIDIFKPEGRNWFWNIYKDLAEKGVAGIWGDLGEPEVHPSALRHATGTADEVHNIYGHNWAKLIFDGYKKEFPNQRPFILMRSGYSGSQRYGMIPWSGDVNRTWGGLSGQPEISLQMGMQGMAYMHSDLGGFAGANLDDELYVRWLQYGVFQPIFRPHAQEDVPSEPVFKSDKAKNLARKAIELRYRMLPYNYTLAFENNQQGTPLMRPLFFDEPQNNRAQLNSSSYLWGNELLVTPIIEAGAKSVVVSFPSDNNWYDFYAGEKHAGGVTKNIATSEENLPVFVRGGAFIPLANLVQTTDNYSLENFELHFYYDASVASSSGKLYHDDGLTPDSYEKGLYELLCFGSKIQENRLTISLENNAGEKSKPADRTVRLVIHNIESKPKNVYTNGKKQKFQYDKKQNTVEIHVLWENRTSKYINIQLVK